MSGLADWPRPFVFRAGHLDGRGVEPGETFHFDLVLFEAPEPVLPYFELSFRQLAQAGIGPGRGRATLLQVEDLARPGQPVFDEGRLINREGSWRAAGSTLLRWVASRGAAPGRGGCERNSGLPRS